MIPWILINNERKYPTFFHNDPNSNITKLNEVSNESQKADFFNTILV